MWRVFSMIPLYAALAQGRVWRWFAMNIPMDLGTGGRFRSDVDIVAKLSTLPAAERWIYKTWEAKVSLLHEDGSASSLKGGKTERLIKQLNAYRDFGSPDVTLLDIYLCESGFMRKNRFPPSSIDTAVRAKLGPIHQQRFGYQMMPFEHGTDGVNDVGLYAYADVSNPVDTTIPLLVPEVSHPKQPFTSWAEHIDEVFEAHSDPRKSMNQVVYCRNCRHLNVVSVTINVDCPICGDNLICQS